MLNSFHKRQSQFYDMLKNVSVEIVGQLSVSKLKLLTGKDFQKFMQVFPQWKEEITP